MRRHPLLGYLLALGLLLVAAAPAAAHTSLAASQPVDGKVLDAAPERVTLTFSDPLGRAGTNTVRGPSGEATAPGTLAPRDARRMTGPVPDQGPGAYAVAWTATSADGHEITGEVDFTVRRPDAARAVATVAARVERCAAVLRRQAERAAAKAARDG
jgi:methionine-rich copper-binding protein CopC